MNIEIIEEVEVEEIKKKKHKNNLIETFDQKSLEVDEAFQNATLNCASIHSIGGRIFSFPLNIFLVISIMLAFSFFIGLFTRISCNFPFR